MWPHDNQIRLLVKKITLPYLYSLKASATWRKVDSRAVNVLFCTQFPESGKDAKKIDLKKKTNRKKERNKKMNEIVIMKRQCNEENNGEAAKQPIQIIQKLV